MASVDCQYAINLQALCHGDNDAVDEVDLAVGVLLENLCAPCEVRH